MKLLPLDILGLSLDEKIIKSRVQLAHAISINDITNIKTHYQLWIAWAIHHENCFSAIGSNDKKECPQFNWNCGSSSSVRFETSCISYAVGRAYFHLRKYFDAWKMFGLAIEEIIQTNDELPLKLAQCVAFRMRCLLRAQRAAICELAPTEWSRMMILATWLEYALRIYKSLNQSKEPLESGISLLATSLAFAAHHREQIVKAIEWKDNPYNHELTTLDTSRPGIEPVPDIGTFDWSRFIADIPFDR